MAKKKVTLEDMLVSKDEVPYEVPENWCWTKYESVIENVSSSSKKIKQKEYLKEGMFPVIDQGSDLIGGYTDDENLLYDGELPVIIFGDHTRCFKYIDFKFAQGADGVKVLKVKPGIDTKYMYYLMLNLELPNKGYSRHYKFLREAKLQIPPLAEQERIVNRIESLFDKVDRAAELVDEASDGFEKRRAAILEMAFSGQLTKRWREENGVSDEWEEVNLGEISELITKGSSPRWQGIEYVEDKSQVLFVTSENVREGYLDLQVEKYLQNEFNEKQKRSILEKEDILLNIVGASIGRAAIFNIDKIANINQAVSLIRLHNKESCKYICYYLNSSYAKQYYLENKVDVARANLSLKDVNNIPIPLPTLKEQNKIIEILDSILSKENEIHEISYLSENIDIIKKSILAKAFRGELGSNDLNEESSIELLKELIK